MVAIIDYGVGNLFSLRSSFEAIGIDVTVTADRGVIACSDRIVLPGVGAFGDAANKLRSSGLADFLCEQVKRGKPLMGICLGMQLLFEKSYEYGVHEGLGLIHGTVRPIADVVPAGYKIPHIGWNSLVIKKNDGLFKGISKNPYVYFVHSYFLNASDKSIVSAQTEYGVTIDAAVEKGNVYATQFHPEKSGETGLKILRNFADIVNG